MCGVAGIINHDKTSVEEDQLRKMMQLIKHRGPDDEGVYLENNVGLGFVRLSILDLTEAGHQPMHSEDKRYTIVYNGEIFNYLELKAELEEAGIVFKTKTDTEVLLKAYIKWGEDCLHKFNGMWAFAIYDKLEKSLFASRDRYGVKPFYYINTKDSFAFSSEIPPLLTLLKGKPKTNEQAIFDFLVFNRTDQNETTFFKEVQKLQHGFKLRIKDGLVKIEKWYDLKKIVSETKGFSSASEYKELFSSSVKLRLRSDVPVGVCLSGGLDSSSIVAVLLKDCNKQDLNTFSAVYNKDEFGDETKWIKEFEPFLKNMFYTRPNAKSLQTDLFDFVKTHAEPIPSTSPYAQYKVMELAKGKVVVTLDGQGADEALAGYHYFFGFYFKDLLRNLKIFRLIFEMFSYIKRHKSLIGIKSFIYFLLPEKVKTKVRVNEKGYINQDFIEKNSLGNGIAGNLYASKSLKGSLLNHFEYKLEHLLKWEDRNAMRFSIEARVPFLDYRLVEKTLASSNTWFIRKGMTKYILRKAMKGILPERIRTRHDKIGFGTPQDEWFRTNEWQKITLDVIGSTSFKNRNIIDSDKARTLYADHLSGKINIANEIWKWVHLELWHREFID